MGTRGLYGVRKGDVDKCTYNHFDSYPEWLGKEVLKFVAGKTIREFNAFFDNIVLVKANDEPTEEMIKLCKKQGIADYDVVKAAREDNYYCLLRDMQGNFELYSRLIDEDCIIPMIDDHNFIKDSLFCEYAYIINLDTNMLEFYEGFQKEPDHTNRYGDEKEDRYYPCKMVLEIPLDKIMGKSDVEIFVVKMRSVLDS